MEHSMTYYLELLMNLIFPMNQHTQLILKQVIRVIQYTKNLENGIFVITMIFKI